MVAAGLIALALLGSGAGAAHLPLGRLAWGRGEGGAPWTPASLHEARAGAVSLDEAVKAIVERAERTGQEAIAPVRELHLQHVLAKDPRHIASVEAVRPLPDVFAWAFCARVAQPAVAARCEGRASRAALAWVRTYVPTGRPVDEVRLFPLMAAIDLLLPLWHAAGKVDEQAAARAWLRAIAQAGDRLYAQFDEKNEVTFNNWQSIRLLLRAAADAIAAPAELPATRALVQAHLPRNLPHADGASVDFHARDALHYHVFDLEPLLLLALLVPDALDAPGRARLEAGVRFLRPFVEGETVHVEYVHSRVQFDQERKRAGQPEFDHKPWDPAEARSALRLARALFPAVRGWTGWADDLDFPAHILAAAALRR